MIKHLNFFAAAVIAFSAAVFIFSAALAMPSYAYFNSHTAPRLNRVSICGVGTDGESIVISPASVSLHSSRLMDSIFGADPAATPSEYIENYTEATPSEYDYNELSATPSEFDNGELDATPSEYVVSGSEATLSEYEVDDSISSPIQ